MPEFIKRNATYLILGLIALVIVAVEAKGKGDFYIFLSAADDLLKGGNIYEIRYSEWYHYYYDLMFALVISPLRFIPLYWAKFIWLLLNVFLTFRLWKIIQYYLPVGALSVRQNRIFSAVSLVVIFALWLKNIHLSQMTIFILYLCLEGLYLVGNRRVLLGSLLIGIGISIKILPLVFIPYFLYRGNFKAALYSILSLIVVLFIPMLFLGFDQCMFLLAERWELVNPLNQEHVLDVSERSFHSLTTLLSVLLVEGAGNSFSLDLKRNIANVSLEILGVVINVVRLCFAALTLYFIRSLPFKAASDRLQVFYESSYLLLIIPLIFPHQQHYAFFFAFPAIAYLAYFLSLRYFNNNLQVKASEKVMVIAVAVLIYFLLNSHFILGQYRNIYDHYKTLTYGVLLLIPLLALASPKMIREMINGIRD